MTQEEINATNWSQSVGGVCIKDGKVLLARHTYGTGKGRLIIPGGYVKIGELAQNALIREFKEETSIIVEPERLIGMRFSEKDWYAIFEVKYVDGIAESDNDENSEVVWVKVEDALKDDAVPDLTKKVIECAVSGNALDEVEYQSTHKGYLFAKEVKKGGTSLSYRTIMIFPEFENIEVIDSIRDRYDPLAKLVRPHITLVFPFESDMSNEELSDILDKRLSGISAFDIEMKGFTKHSDIWGNTLFLDIVKGQDSIRKIHDVLYENEFKEYNLGFEYYPHMTVGKLESEEEMDEAYEAIKSVDDVFRTRVNKISVEMIGKNEESIIIIEKDI